MNDDFLYNQLNRFYDEDTAKKIIGYSKKRSFSSFRINNIKSNKNEVEEELRQHNIHFKNVKWFNDAYVVDAADENKIIELSIFTEGKIYLQNLSTMIPVLMLEPKANENILDICSAPGGKTTLIQSITNNKCNLTATELNPIRFQKLEYNCKHQGANVYCMNKDGRTLDEMMKFDKIIVDAPCTGSGTLDISNDNYKKYFTEALLKKSIDNQYKLLKKAIKLVKKGGSIVYSTCSILDDENENLLNRVLKDYNKKINNQYVFDYENVLSIDTDLDFAKADLVKILPNEYFEGFFVAKFIV